MHKIQEMSNLRAKVEFNNPFRKNTRELGGY